MDAKHNYPLHYDRTSINLADDRNFKNDGSKRIDQVFIGMRQPEAQVYRMQ